MATMQPSSSTRSDTGRRWQVALALLALAGLALRITYVLLSKNPRAPGGDAFYFHYGANLLVDGRGFIDPIALLFLRYTTPGAVHPPAYLLFLATASLVGFRSFLDHQIWSCILGAGTIVLIGFTGRAIAGRRVGLIAAFIVAIYPNFWFHDSVVMSETLIMFTTTLVILVAYRFWQRPSVRRALGLGAAVGIATLTRAESILLVVVLLLPLAYVLRDLDLRARLKLFAVSASATLITVSPWVIYNLTRFDHPVTLSSNLEATLAAAQCDQVYSGKFIGFWSYSCVLAMTPPKGDASTKAIYYRHKVFHYVGNHASRVPVVVLAREGRTWAVFHPIQQVTLDEIEGQERWLARTGLAMYYALAGASIGGVIVLRRRRVTVVPALGVIVAVAVTVGVVYGTTRFRTPAEVPIVLLAAVAFDEAIRVAQAKRSRAVHGDGSEAIKGGAAPDATARQRPSPAG
jgi:4-amino-4-deoxy-L-arabinose transferase-like glycosyltransferase